MRFAISNYIRYVYLAVNHDTKFDNKVSLNLEKFSTKVNIISSNRRPLLLCVYRPRPHTLMSQND